MNIMPKIIDFVSKHGGNNNFKSWVTGIAKNAEDALFNTHKVNKASEEFIFFKTTGDNEAVGIEERLIDMGFEGKNGGRSKESVELYVYKKAPGTRP